MTLKVKFSVYDAHPWRDCYSIYVTREGLEIKKSLQEIFRIDRHTNKRTHLLVLFISFLDGNIVSLLVNKVCVSFLEH